MGSMPSRTERPPLTRDAIVAKAVEVADAEGLDAVSIRRLAAELPARPMSLYNHIADKEQLVGLMLDRVVEENLIGDALSADWREAMRQIAQVTRASAERHPWLLSAHVRTAERRESFNRHHDESLRALDGLDAGRDDKLRLLVAVDTYTLGQVAMRSAHRAAAFDDFSVPRDTFETGLEWLLEGAAARLGAT
jgi:AcrR family transcriptional regulator